MSEDRRAGCVARAGELDRFAGLRRSRRPGGLRVGCSASGRATERQAKEREGRELMGQGPLFIAAPALDVSPSQAAVKLTALKRKRVG